MKVSVIIATRNRADVLARCLSEYDKQTYPEIEIVVADNGSSDHTFQMLAERFPKVVALRFEENIGPLALNAAVEASSGELLWRTDDDAYPDSPGTLADAVAFMEKYPDVVAISGEIREATIGYKLTNYYPFDKGPGPAPADGYPFYGFCGAAAMIRRKAFIEAGGFWDAFYHEEDELSIRMLLRGGRIRYVPSIRVVHLSAFAGEGNMEARWQLMFSQTTRMQWKYWPRLVAWYRSQVVALGMVMSAVFHRFPLRTIVNGWRQARATAYKAWTQEHINVSYAEMRRITMRRSIWHHMFHYYWLRLKRRTRNA